MIMYGQGGSTTHRPIVPIHSGLMATTGDQYRRTRERLGLSREELAARAGVSTKTVQRAEEGRSIRDTSRARLYTELGLTPPTPAGPRARSITEFTDSELVADLMRRLNEGRRHRAHHGVDAHSHTDIDDDPGQHEGLPHSG